MLCLNPKSLAFKLIVSVCNCLFAKASVHQSWHSFFCNENNIAAFDTILKIEDTYGIIKQVASKVPIKKSLQYIYFRND